MKYSSSSLFILEVAGNEGEMLYFTERNISLLRGGREFGGKKNG
jgi:hypothetical protein